MDKYSQIYYDKVIGPKSINNGTFFSSKHHKRFRKYYSKWEDEIKSYRTICEWGNEHKLKRSYMSFWSSVESFIICGPKIHWDKKRKEWGWSDKIHLYSKLIRKNMNWYDKLRFRIVTGVKYE